MGAPPEPPNVGAKCRGALCLPGMDLLRGLGVLVWLVTDTVVKMGFVCPRRPGRELELLQEMKPHPAKPGDQPVLGMFLSPSCS